MDKNGGQWAQSVLSMDGSANADTQRGQQTDGCLYAFDAGLVMQKKAAFSSMDAGGFTVNFTNATSNSAGQVISLALKGVAAKAGSFDKSISAPAAAYVQSQNNSTTANVTSANITLPATTAGNLIVVSLDVHQPAVVSSVVDDRGNTYRRAVGPTNWGPSPDRLYTYYAKNITGGATTITVNLSGSSNGWLELFATEFRGIDTVDPLDQTSEATGTGNPMAGGAVTTTSPDEVLYAVCGADSGTINLGSFTQREGAANGNPTGDASVTSIGTYPLTSSIDFGDWACQLLSFRHFGAKQPVPGIGFSPDAVLLASVQDVMQVSPSAPVAHTRFGIGAADSSFHQGSSALSDQDAAGNMIVQGIDKTSRAFVKADNTGSTNAEAVLYSMDGNGFTLDWTKNDGVATQMLYLALGMPKPGTFTRARTVTVPTSSLGASCTASLTSFPILVSLTGDLELRTVGHGGYVQSASGYDIVFEDGYNNPLDYEIEQYTSTAGGATLVAWVRVPKLSVLGATAINMRYGNASLTSPTANPAGVWNDAFKGVWHLSNNSFVDSTSNGNNGANTGTTNFAGQKIADSRSFNGSSNISAPNSASLSVPDLTMESWVFLADANTDQKILGKADIPCCPAGTGYILGVRWGGLYPELWDTTNTHYTFDAGSIGSNTWVHLAVTWATGSRLVGYVNGAQVASIPVGTNPLGVNALPFYIGVAPYNAAEYWVNGRVDEPRISNQARSQCWIETEYKNQSVPGTFSTLGSVSTAVGLVSFSASGRDGAVDLAWQTGSEVDNLGFHLYRGLSSTGPWTRLTSSLIPGQGFSATGASYSWRDTGLANGTRYFYRLEDVDTKSVSTFHDPVSAVPQAEAPPPPAEGGGSGSGTGGTGSGGLGSSGGSASSSCPAWALAQLAASASSYTCETHGGSASSSFRILSRTAGSALVELETPGFLTARDASGRVRALLPGVDTVSDPLAPALPTKRAVLDGVVGRQARIRTIDSRENRFFSGLTAAAVGYPQALVAPDGTVRPGRREAELGISRGAYPLVQARLAGEAFQGETKTLALELMPLRYDASRGALVLSQRLTVRVDFAGAVAAEVGRGGFGRRVPRSRPDSNAYAFLATSRKGLHAVSFESLFPGRSRPLDPSLLRLTRDSGRVLVPFHVSPQDSLFGPGSRLFFIADILAPSTSFSSEVVYALERGTGGARMSLLPAPVDASAPASSKGFGEWETSRYFIADVLDAGDLWQWESLAGGASTTKTFALDGLDSSSSETAHLRVSLQGGSDAEAVVDHHVQVFVGNALVAETTFDGAVPHEVEADVELSLLLAGTNELRILNVGDTGVYSRVLLDRFEIAYPQTTAARSGLFEGRFSSGGTAEVTGLVSPAALVDATSASWLSGFDAGSSLRFHAEADHRYFAVSAEALLSPRVFFPQPSARLRSAANQADYLLIAPQAFLPAAQSLLDRRASEGLTTFAASLEEITSAFGAGQPSGEALRDFLPSPTTTGHALPPATSSSSATRTTTLATSPPTHSPRLCPISSRRAPTCGPGRTPLSSPSTGMTSCPISPSVGFPPPPSSRPRTSSPRSSTGRTRDRTSTARSLWSPTTPTPQATSRPTCATSSPRS